MNITLRQLLPQVAGRVMVKQPYTYTAPDTTIFNSLDDMTQYFSDDELDRYIETVTTYEGYSEAMLLIIMKEVARP